MARTTILPSQPGKRPSDRGARIKRSFAQSTYVTTAWTWFMVLAGKAAEPVLVTSVLYASVKLLPIVHFPPQCDAVVFVAQFIALDVGGLSLNKLADQALKVGNTEGARQAKRLSIALVGVMLAGVIIAGIDQVVKLDEQFNTIIDTILLVARAIMAVLYSRVIHALREDDPFTYTPDRDGTDVQSEVTEAVHEALAALAAQMKADQAEQVHLLRELVAAQSALLKGEQAALFRDLTQHQEQQFNQLERRQQIVLAQINEKQAQTLAVLSSDTVKGSVTERLGAAPETRGVRTRETTPTPKAHVSVNGAPVPETSVSRKQISRAADSPGTRNSGTVENEVDKAVWPLLEAGKTVRGIAAETGIKNATVGRSRLRWTAGRKMVSTSDNEREKLSHEFSSNGMSLEESGGEHLP